MPYLVSSGGSSAKCETLARREKGQQNKTKKQKEGEIHCVVLPAPNTPMMSLYNNLQFAIFITAL